jgi:ATP-dependent helicase HrpA
MTVPLHLLNQVDERRCEWLVPGLLREKVTHHPRVAQEPAQALRPGAASGHPGDGASGAGSSLTVALSQALLRVTGVDVPQDTWNLGELPPSCG